jgi:hypothetical protein
MGGYLFVRNVSGVWWMVLAAMMVSALIAGGFVAALSAKEPQKLPIRVDRRDRRR